MSVVFCFVLLAKAAGQDIGGNAGTNQPGAQAGSTNAAPIQNIELPSEYPEPTNRFTPQNSFSNQFGVTPGPPPPLIGPVSVGSVQPKSPIMGTSALAGAPSPIGAAPLGPGIPVWGPIDIHPHLNYTVSYGNGLQAQPGQQSKTTINTVTPGFLLDFGKHWSIDYSPSFAFYSNPAFKNTTDESVNLRGNWESEDWVLGLTQSYVSSDQPLIETGAQTAQEAYATELTALHHLNTEWALQMALNQNFRDAAALNDVHEWVGDTWLNYQPNKAFGTGIGLVLGYDKDDPGSDMPFEQLQGVIHFTPGPKFSLHLSAGIEDRQFTGPSAPSLLSPIFSAGLSYQIFTPTSVSIGAGRSVTPSFYGNQIEVNTTLSASIQQALSKKITFSANAGYNTEPQTSIVAAPLPQFFLGTPPRGTLQEVRNDNSTSFTLSLSYAMAERASLSLFYTVSDNSSGQSSFAYSSHQVGLTFSYRY